jgi:hypothetical protein
MKKKRRGEKGINNSNNDEMNNNPFLCSLSFVLSSFGPRRQPLRHRCVHISDTTPNEWARARPAGLDLHHRRNPSRSSASAHKHCFFCKNVLRLYGHRSLSLHPLELTLTYPVAPSPTLLPSDTETSYTCFPHSAPTMLSRLPRLGGSLRNASGTGSSARHHPLFRAASKQAQLQQQAQGFASAEVRVGEEKRKKTLPRHSFCLCLSTPGVLTDANLLIHHWNNNSPPPRTMTTHHLSPSKTSPRPCSASAMASFARPATR